jgi:hypothetical protein
MFGGNLNVFGGTFFGIRWCLTVFGGKKTHPTFDPSPEILILSVSGFT